MYPVEGHYSAAARGRWVRNQRPDPSTRESQESGIYYSSAYRIGMGLCILQTTVQVCQLEYHWNTISVIMSKWTDKQQASARRITIDFSNHFDLIINMAIVCFENTTFAHLVCLIPSQRTTCAVQRQRHGIESGTQWWIGGSQMFKALPSYWTQLNLCVTSSTAYLSLSLSWEVLDL